ncbi:MAG: hypothetical protein QF578_11170 [Alphaproteobacteria bacterium]|nr:hypothetical protein [Alphaproteobacteria bacterium]MDP6565376.1 hypothetical protein [Alphaproteobacteria bacterium]MDP6813524.1 hypothetical protein [Alphaproteobacteria bacterium]
MTITCEIDHRKRLTLVRGSGELNEQEILEFVDALISDPDFDPSYHFLGDLTATTKMDVSSDTIQRLARMEMFTEDSKRAYVATRRFVFGLLRMMELTANDPAGNVKVFADLAEARAWLGLD